MTSLRIGLQEYIETICSRKKRLLLATLISVILFGISCHYLYDGVNKRLLIYTFLCFGIGAFIICPRLKKWYFYSLVLLLYILIVPLKLFQRIEIPVHDMSKILESASFVNVLIILLIYAFFFLIFQRVRFAFGVGNLFLLILFLINYYLYLFRRSSLTIFDLMATKTALTVLHNYHLTMKSELWYSILYFLFFIAFGFWCDIPAKGKKYHLVVTVVALMYCLFFYVFWNKTDYLEKHELKGHYWPMSENEQLNGFLLSFGISMSDMEMEKPNGYSQKALLEIASQAEEIYQPKHFGEEIHPNIILIMNEAWSDLRVLGNLETSDDFMPFVDSLTNNTIKGNTYVEVLGGITANTEFEVLTGDSLALFTLEAIPYQLQVNHDMYSLAEVLKEQGYQTMAMHPGAGAAWHRENVYRYFGFEEFIDMNRFETEHQYVGNFLSDECNFNEIIWQYEHKKKDVPLFLFDVTIQNHADYYGNTEILLDVEKVGNTPVAEIAYIYDVDSYLNLMKVTDDAFQKLISYFQEVDEPTIICMFGDHQPILNDEFYNTIFGDRDLSEREIQAFKYITPYVIWANYDAGFSEYGDMSANYLGAAVLECAGVDLPAYYKFLLQLQKQYPEVSFRTIDELSDDEMIKQYRMLQYNHLMEKNYIKSIFSVVQ